MIFRLLTIGLGVACVVLLVSQRPVQIQVVRSVRSARSPAAVTDRASALSVVDVAAEVAPSSIPELVRLTRGEWIRAINDREPDDDAAAAWMMSSLARHGSFLDLTIARGPSERRVLLLIH